MSPDSGLKNVPAFCSARRHSRGAPAECAAQALVQIRGPKSAPRSIFQCRCAASNRACTQRMVWHSVLAIEPATKHASMEPSTPTSTTYGGEGGVAAPYWCGCVKRYKHIHYVNRTSFSKRERCKSFKQPCVTALSRQKQSPFSRLENEPAFLRRARAVRCWRA